MFAKHHQRGMTLIELIVFIIIVSVAIVGVLSVMDLVVKSSADPMVAKQSIAMADAVLEEVMAKSYNDPGGTSGETTRTSMDDVFDYNYFDGSTTARKILGSQLLSGSTGPLPDTYWAMVAVTATSVSSQTMALVTVTVTNPKNETFVLTGYAGNY